MRTKAAADPTEFGDSNLNQLGPVTLGTESSLGPSEAKIFGPSQHSMPAAASDSIVDDKLSCGREAVCNTRV